MRVSLFILIQRW